MTLNSSFRIELRARHIVRIIVVILTDISTDADKLRQLDLVLGSLAVVPKDLELLPVLEGVALDNVVPVLPNKNGDLLLKLVPLGVSLLEEDVEEVRVDLPLELHPLAVPVAHPPLDVGEVHVPGTVGPVLDPCLVSLLGALEVGDGLLEGLVVTVLWQAGDVELGCQEELLRVVAVLRYAEDLADGVVDSVELFPEIGDVNVINNTSK